MNPRLFLISLVIAVFLFSCTKDTLSPQNPTVLTESALKLIYPDEPEIESSDSRVVSFNPPATSQPCKADVPSILMPQIIVGDSINIIYANIEEFPGNVNPQSIRWTVDGDTVLQLTTKLYIPYALNEYDIEATVTLKDGKERRYKFTINVTHNVPLDDETGFIEYDEDDMCVIGDTVGQSCLQEGERAIGIVIVDPIF